MLNDESQDLTLKAVIQMANVIHSLFERAVILLYPLPRTIVYHVA